MVHAQLNAEELPEIDETKKRDFDIETVVDSTEWVDAHPEVGATDSDWPSQSESEYDGDDDGGDDDGGDDDEAAATATTTTAATATTAATDGAATGVSTTAATATTSAAPTPRNPLLVYADQFPQPKPHSQSESQLQLSQTNYAAHDSFLSEQMLANHRSAIESNILNRLALRELRVRFHLSLTAIPFVAAISYLSAASAN